MGQDYSQASAKRVLEPIERISEILFGLIMVLSFTCSFSVAGAGRLEIRTMLIGALGCNLAWGIIDGIMYLMGCLAEKARSFSTVQAVRRARNPEKAHRTIASALPPLLASVIETAELENIRKLLERLPEPPSRPRLTLREWRGALGVFSMVVLSTFPVTLPFLLMTHAMQAQRLSNAIAIVMLFLTGYAFGRCIGYHPRVMGLSMVALGVVLVGLTIALGG